MIETSDGHIYTYSPEFYKLSSCWHIRNETHELMIIIMIFHLFWGHFPITRESSWYLIRILYPSPDNVRTRKYDMTNALSVLVCKMFTQELFWLIPISTVCVCVGMYKAIKMTVINCTALWTQFG